MMKVLVKESQLRRIFEIVTKDKIICDECGWSWDLTDGGDNPFYRSIVATYVSENEFKGI